MSEMETADAITEGAEEIGGALSPEEQARTLGWKPQDEYDGKGEWVDADTFLTAREENLGIAKRDAKILKRENETLSRKLNNAQKMIDQLSKFEQNAYNRALNDLKVQQKQAVRDGDEDAHDRISKEIDELRDKAGEAKDDKPKQFDQKAYQKSFSEWLADNEWYAKDEVRRTYADSVIADLGPLEEYDGTADEWLAEIADRTNKRFIKKEKADPKVNPVAGAQGMRQPGAKGKAYADMPADAKQMADMMVRQGIFKDKDAYAKEYWKNV